MSASCKMIATAMEELAPLEFAEPWDNVGLLVGSPDKKVAKALLAVDVTAAVIEEAVGTEAGMIISHHPFLFHSMKSIRTDTTAGALLAELLRKDISVYAAHTNLDAAPGGVNDALAGVLQLQDVSPLQPAKRPLVKIVTFVPAGDVEAVWQAMNILGAMGLSREAGMEELYRDIRMLPIPDGTNEILALIHGRELTGVEAFRGLAGKA